MKVFLSTFILFLIGGMPFSFWLGMLLIKKDIRKYGDGNPGAANAWKAGGWKIGMLAGLLDFLKGAIPVYLVLSNLHLSGWEAVPICVAPVFGHSFSPFLRFRGGKSVAVTFGIWAAVIPVEGVLALGASLLIIFLIQETDTWTVLLGMSLFGIYLVFKNTSPHILAIWAVNITLLFWKHRSDISEKIIIRNWIARRVQND